MKGSRFFRLIVYTLLFNSLFFLFSVLCSSLDWVKEDYSLSYTGYLNIVRKNDAFWYTRIAKEGYPEVKSRKDLGYSDKEEYHQSAWAFFPFYPILLSTASRITGLYVETVGVMLSLLFAAIAAWGFNLFAVWFFKDKEKAFYSTLLWIVFPFHYYFSVLYTEAVFFILLIFSFIAIIRNQMIVFSLLLVPLVLTRPNGLILLIPLFLFFLEQKGALEGHKINFEKLLDSKTILHSLSFLSAPLTFAGYCLYQYSMTGYYFAFSIAQDGWYREFMFPFLSFFRTGELASQFNSVYTILVMLFAVFIRKKMTLSLNVLIWMSLLLPLTSGSVISMQRYIVMIFPLFLIIGAYFYTSPRKFVVLGALFLLQLVSFYFWIANHPFSY